MKNDYEKHDKVRKMRFETMPDDKKFWSDEETKTLERRFADGYGITDIALELNRSEGAVYQRIVARDLFTNMKKRSPKKPKTLECICMECAQYENCPHTPLKINECTAIR